MRPDIMPAPYVKYKDAGLVGATEAQVAEQDLEQTDWAKYYYDWVIDLQDFIKNECQE